MNTTQKWTSEAQKIVAHSMLVERATTKTVSVFYQTDRAKQVAMIEEIFDMLKGVADE